MMRMFMVSVNSPITQIKILAYSFYHVIIWSGAVNTIIQWFNYLLCVSILGFCTFVVFQPRMVNDWKKIKTRQKAIFRLPQIDRFDWFQG